MQPLGTSYIQYKHIQIHAIIDSIILHQPQLLTVGTDKLSSTPTPSESTIPHTMDDGIIIYSTISSTYLHKPPEPATVFR